MTNESVVIHQPDFMPYLGFFDKLLQADIFVVFDMVQFERRGWTNRDKIKTRSGERWITVPIQKADRNTAIQDIMLAEDDQWRQNHLRVLEENYGKAKYYEEIIPYIERLYSQHERRLMDFNMHSIQLLMDLLDVTIKIQYASNLDLHKRSNELIVEIMNALGAVNYLSGTGAIDYFVEKPYRESGINVIWQDYKPLEYPQQFGEFIPYLSSIDVLFNCGIKNARKLLRGEQI